MGVFGAAKPAWEYIARFAAEEYRYKYMFQRLALKPVVQLPDNICKYYITPIANAAKREYNEMYNNNELFIRNIADYLGVKFTELG